MKKVHQIILSVLAIAILGTGLYFAFYLPHSREALAANEQECADLEPIFIQNYSELNATTSEEMKVDFSHHYSIVAGKCFMKIQRHDCMQHTYTCTEKTMLYDSQADKLAAICTSMSQRGIEIFNQCTEGEKTITSEEFSKA